MVRLNLGPNFEVYGGALFRSLIQRIDCTDHTPDKPSGLLGSLAVGAARWGAEWLLVGHTPAQNLLLRHIGIDRVRDLHIT